MTDFSRIRYQFARNADGLERLLMKAVRTGNRANGYTADELRTSLADYRRLSTANNATLQAHFDAQLVKIRTRLQEMSA